MNVPGLKIIIPTTPRDAKGLMVAAIRDDNPVICFEDATLRGRKLRGPIPDADDFIVPLGVASVVRPGSDVTVVAIGGSVPKALEAAEAAAHLGISVEVIDPRTLAPFDWDTVLASVHKTGRLVAVDPAHQTCSVASEVAATVAEQEFRALRSGVVRVTTPDIQIPAARGLERDLYPTTARILAAVTHVMQE